MDFRRKASSGEPGISYAWSRGWDVFARLGVVRTVLAAGIAFVLVASLLPNSLPRGQPLSPPPGPSPLATFTAFPTLDPDDGKFMSVAGQGLQTLAGIAVVTFVGVPKGTSSFEVGIFDGDTSANWDSGSDVVKYKLYRDALKTGSTASLVAQWTSGDSVNDDWYTKTFNTDSAAQAPSGNYFYRLEVNWNDPGQSTSFNNFKTRATGQVSLRAGQEFGFTGGPQRVPPVAADGSACSPSETPSDPPVGSPDPNPGGTNDPDANTYNGDWPWYFYVPTALASIAFRDGDSDRADDENSPGLPPDSPSTYDACANIEPNIFYDVTEPPNPAGVVHVYTNNNPSGNTEWEDFTIGPSPGDDVVINYALQPGLWKLRVQAMDAHNFNVMRANFEVYSTPDPPLTVNPTPEVEPDHELTTKPGVTVEYGHNVTNKGTNDSFDLRATSAHAWVTRIYQDTNGNGVADPGEPQVSMTPPLGTNQSYAIVVQLDVPPGLPSMDDVTTVRASSRTEWALQDDALDTTHVKVNEKPTAKVGGPYFGNEGSPITFDGDGSSDPDAQPQPLTYRWDFQADGTWDTNWSSDPTAAYTWGDDWTGTVRLEVSDGDLTDTDETSVQVSNVSPTIEFTTIPSGDEAESLVFRARVTDPGSDDLLVTWSGECAGWSGATSYPNDPANFPDPDPSPDVHPRDILDEQTVVCGDNGAFAWGLKAEDDDGGLLGVGGSFDVDNLPPGYPIEYCPQIVGCDDVRDEGEVTDYGVSAFDPGSDDLTFMWTWGDGSPAETGTYFNDGVGPDPPQSPDGTFPFYAEETRVHVYADNGLYLIRVDTEDDDAGVNFIEATVTILNVPPTVAATDASGDEGASVPFAATFSDPGFDFPPADSVEDFTATIDWGDGSVESVAVSEVPGGPGVPTTGTVSGVHVYGDNAVFSVIVTVCDDDGGCGAASASITVDNVAPAPSIDEATQEQDRHLPAGHFYPLDPITFNGSGVDPGSDDLAFEWDFGDGTSVSGGLYFNDGVGPDPFPSPGGIFPFAAKDSIQHVYDLPGDYLVTLTVRDDDAGVSQATFPIHITSAADLKAEAIQRIKALKQQALDRPDWRFVENLDDAERAVWKSLGYKHPFRPDAIDPDLAGDVSVGRNKHDRIDLVLGPSWDLAPYDALLVYWDDGVVTTIDLPDGWPSKPLKWDDEVWVDAWEQDLAIQSKRDKKTGLVTLRVHAHDASLGLSLSLDDDTIAHLDFTYEILPWWIDSSHLDPKMGHRVFNCERAAVNSLVKLVVPDDDDDEDDRGYGGVLDGDDDEDEDDDDEGGGCGCGGGDDDDEDDDCDDDDDDDDEDEDGSGVGPYRVRGRVLGGNDDDDDEDDDDEDDDDGCSCGDDDDDDDEDDEDDDDDENPGPGTIHCRLTPKLWNETERAALDAECDLIANLLVKADEMLARIALEEAKETPIQDPKKEKKVEHEIGKAEKSMAKAYEAWDELEYGRAICQFGKAWKHAQHAIKHAGK